MFEAHVNVVLVALQHDRPCTFLCIFDHTEFVYSRVHIHVLTSQMYTGVLLSNDIHPRCFAGKMNRTLCWNRFQPGPQQRALTWLLALVQWSSKDAIAQFTICSWKFGSVEVEANVFPNIFWDHSCSFLARWNIRFCIFCYRSRDQTSGKPFMRCNRARERF